MPVPRYNGDLWYHYSEVEKLIDNAIADEREAVIQIMRDKKLNMHDIEMMAEAIRNRGKK